MSFFKVTNDPADKLGKSAPYSIEKKQFRRIVANALAEDIAGGDVTTDTLVATELQGRAVILVKQDGVLAGMDVAEEVFRQVDPELLFVALVRDGTKVREGELIGSIAGSMASILKAERTALNFLQHLSGIATETARYVEAVAGTKAVVVDTRKTMPGLRLLGKYAVYAGGGRNHRMNLSDGILIKDNHLALLRSSGIELGEAIRKTRDISSGALKVEVEAESVDDVCEALAAGADIIMLDNMKVPDMRAAVALVQGRALLEASGGITLDTIRSVAETGVDLISVGALTHSVKSLDISLEVAAS